MGCAFFMSNNIKTMNYNFKPFDRVVARNDGNTWHIDFFEVYQENEYYHYHCLNSWYRHCLPYNDKTAHLVGTNEDYKEQ